MILTAPQAASFRTWENTHSGAAHQPAHWPHLVACELLGQPLALALPAVLKRLGHLGAADRVYVIEYDGALRLFRNTHEWTRRGVTSHVQALQNTPVDMLGRLHREALAGHAVAVLDTGRMPKDARALQAEFQRQGNKSVLCLPLVFEGRLCGLFGFDATRQHTQWSDEVVAAMFGCAELLAMALHGGAARRAHRANSGSRAGGDARSPAEPANFAALVYLRHGSGLRGIPLASIVALRAQRNHSEVFLEDGGTHSDARSLKEWEALLPADPFMRVHRGAIVRTDAVRELVRRPSGRWHVTLPINAGVWNVSREALAGLRSRISAAPGTGMGTPL
ncbi:GAF domain-containing DNA-binding protein [Polaromonas sp. SM01]|uniref:GAF domain-containing DNA-binding protein n=1 Tax=Polaromonas sp. SM01 TaxID=3085630 RepID=UPI002981FE41|nr:GAF domain-containing DNA-binding protein [Polaromonas sp. SM01]MDW5442309.1 GAF domain-containing DNA-binding protein [Polaromonas sp. SM01]